MINLVTLFLKDYLQVKEWSGKFKEYFQFLRKEKSETCKLKFPTEDQRLVKQVKWDISDQFIHLYHLYTNNNKRIYT